MGTKEGVLVAVAIKANQDPLTNNKETSVACKFAIQKNSDIVKRHKCVRLCFLHCVLVTNTHFGVTCSCLCLVLGKS